MLEPSNRPVTGLHFSSAFPPLSQNGSEYEVAYTAHRDSSSLNLDRNETNRYAQQCHDATWALAFALNRTITGKIVCLSLSVSVCLSCHTKYKVSICADHSLWEGEKNRDITIVHGCFFRAWRELNSKCRGVGSCWTPGQWHISPGSFLLQQQCTIGGDIQTCTGYKLYWNHCEWRGWEGMGGRRNKRREAGKHSVGQREEGICRKTEKKLGCLFISLSSYLIWMSYGHVVWSPHLCRVRCHLVPMESGQQKDCRFTNMYFTVSLPLILSCMTFSCSNLT